jgi:hypothetical protein
VCVCVYVKGRGMCMCVLRVCLCVIKVCGECINVYIPIYCKHLHICTYIS